MSDPLGTSLYKSFSLPYTDASTLVPRKNTTPSQLSSRTFGLARAEVSSGKFSCHSIVSTPSPSLPPSKIMTSLEMWSKHSVRNHGHPWMII